MMRSPRFLPRLLVAAAIAGAATPAAAVDEHALLAVPLTQAPGARFTALTVTYRPGQSSAPHRHEADAFVYVLAGHVRSQLDATPARVYAPGESWFEPAGAHHVLCGNASRSETATMLVVFVARPQARLHVADQPATPARTQSR
ncbi:cupin domain-containing protein [Rhodanobacter denitrificans]|uniref:Cupin domain-containing protein n=1 Tax=Rhodanobacter denitrificans TaxID=666685 RepID=A0A368KBA8_9GAMM|nr:cupin domain-containing protein [Rhodanobacter denitrificans]RCS29229.1 cupin domain-containing protein [Rhodanobacter denitrificans]